MTKVKILTDGGYYGDKFKNAIGKVFDADIVGGSDLVKVPDLDDLSFWVGTECEIVEDGETEETHNYADQAAKYGICITAPDGVVYDGRDK